jgi:sulfur-carrier protein
VTDAGVRVRIPPVLRAATNGAYELKVRGDTIREALDDAAKRMPALKLHLFDEAGRIRHHIICIHDDCVVRANEMASRAVRTGDEIVLANAFAGG